MFSNYYYYFKQVVTSEKNLSLYDDAAVPRCKGPTCVCRPVIHALMHGLKRTLGSPPPTHAQLNTHMEKLYFFAHFKTRTHSPAEHKRKASPCFHTLA